MFNSKKTREQVRAIASIVKDGVKHEQKGMTFCTSHYSSHSIDYCRERERGRTCECVDVCMWICACECVHVDVCM